MISVNKLQKQYDKILFFFRTTTEPYDSLEWDGKTLEVWNDEKLVEKYKKKDLSPILFEFFGEKF